MPVPRLPFDGRGRAPNPPLLHRRGPRKKRSSGEALPYTTRFEQIAPEEWRRAPFLPTRDVRCLPPRFVSASDEQSSGLDAWPTSLARAGGESRRDRPHLRTPSVNWEQQAPPWTVVFRGGEVSSEYGRGPALDSRLITAVHFPRTGVPEDTVAGAIAAGFPSRRSWPGQTD